VSVIQKLTNSIWNKYIIVPGRKQFDNEELRDLYSSPSIIRTIKSRRKRWAGHVTRLAGEGERV
jgi:hypothetical protein